jgi:hypothetical protein
MSDFAPRSREVGSLLFGGGVLLVFGAVVLSLMESSYSGAAASSNENQDLEDLLERGESQLAKVGVEIGIERKKLGRWEKQLAADREYRLLEDALGLASSKNADLILAVSKVEEEIGDLAAKRVSYQGRMRERLWPQFSNQELKEDFLLRSSEFKNAIITGVDAAGLMIRHQSGVARIPVAHLSLAFREKLDLNLEEATEMMLKIYSRDAKLRRGQEDRRGEGIETPEMKADAKRAKTLAEGKEKVAKLLKLIAFADAEAANARSQDRRSSSRSAPGSLETWTQRASRFEQVAMSYRNQFAATVLALRKMDPGNKGPLR